MYDKYFDIYSGYHRYFCTDNEYFTSVVKFKGDDYRSVLPVKTNLKINLRMLIECSRAIRRLFIGDNIRFGDTVCKNIINSRADIICMKTHSINR